MAFVGAIFGGCARACAGLARGCATCGKVTCKGCFNCGKATCKGCAKCCRGTFKQCKKCCKRGKKGGKKGRSRRSKPKKKKNEYEDDGDWDMESFLEDSDEWSEDELDAGAEQGELPPLLMIMNREGGAAPDPNRCVTCGTRVDT